MPEKAPEKVERNERSSLVGIVTSNRMVKTITVKVERFVRHPKFEKYVKRFTTCYAHDEKREAKIGDRVEIMETRPLSRQKRWRLIKVLGQGSERDLIRASRPTTGK